MDNLEVDKDEIHTSLDEYNEQKLADLHEYFDEAKVEPNRNQRDLTWLNDPKFKQLDLNDEHLVFIAIDPGVNCLATVVYIQAEEGRSALETLEVKLRQPIRDGFQTKMIKTSDYHETVQSQLTAEEKMLCKDVFSTPKYTFHAVDCKMKARDAALKFDQRMPLYMDKTIQKALFKEHFTKSALQQIAKDICKLPRKQAKQLEIGTVVFVLDVNRESKWDAIYEGPYEIVGIDGKKAYVLKDEMGAILNKHVSREHLKVRSQMFADLSVLEVESIQDHRGSDRDGFEYLVRWKKLDASEDSCLWLEIHGQKDIKIDQ
ncbi:hypothetical protein MP228_003321 [Amoeboaphelidium protococcarum]|nr:hypothetical protein MP228_003321 [Amoeboaphelidium protococcarum]